MSDITTGSFDWQPDNGTRYQVTLASDGSVEAFRYMLILWDWSDPSVGHAILLADFIGYSVLRRRLRAAKSRMLEGDVLGLAAFLIRMGIEVVDLPADIVPGPAAVHEMARTGRLNVR